MEDEEVEGKRYAYCVGQRITAKAHKLAWFFQDRDGDEPREFGLSALKGHFTIGALYELTTTDNNTRTFTSGAKMPRRAEGGEKASPERIEAWLIESRECRQQIDQEQAVKRGVRSAQEQNEEQFMDLSLAQIKAHYKYRTKGEKAGFIALVIEALL